MSEYYTYRHRCPQNCARRTVAREMPSCYVPKENARSLESMGVIDGTTIQDIIQRLSAWCKSWARDMRTKDAVAAFAAVASMFALVLALGVAKLAGCY